MLGERGNLCVDAYSVVNSLKKYCS